MRTPSPHAGLRFAGALVAGLLLAACDAAPGIAPPPGRPPVLSDLAFAPDEAVELTALPPERFEGETVRIPLAMGVTVTDPDGGVDVVRYVVVPPQEGAQPVAAGPLTREDPLTNRYTASPTVLFPATESGLYTVVLYAIDDEGGISNEVRTLLRVTAEGEPPVIESVDVPEEIRLPPAGQAELIPISAVVSDPDGLANILRVELRPNGGSPILLCDDGGGEPCGDFPDSGDAVAGDGRFTITVEITSANQPGTNTFAFQAFDRFGERSEVVTRTVRIVE